MATPDYNIADWLWNDEGALFLVTDHEYLKNKLEICMFMQVQSYSWLVHVWSESLTKPCQYNLLASSMEQIPYMAKLLRRKTLYLDRKMVIEGNLSW